MVHRSLIADWLERPIRVVALSLIAATWVGPRQPPEDPGRAVSARHGPRAAHAARPPQGAATPSIEQDTGPTADPSAVLAQLGGAVTAVAMHGDRVFVGEGTRLVVYRDVPGRAPRLLARGEPGLMAVTAIEVAADGRSVWLAAGDGPVRGYRVAEDGSLRAVARFEPPGRVAGMALQGERLWLACGDEGVAVYDLAAGGRNGPPRLVARATHEALSPTSHGTPEVASINDVVVVGDRVVAVGGPDVPPSLVVGLWSWISSVGEPPPDTYVGTATPVPTRGASPTPTPTPRFTATRSPPPAYGFALSLELEGGAAAEEGPPRPRSASMRRFSPGPRIRRVDAVAIPGSLLAVAASELPPGVLWGAGPGNVLQGMTLGPEGRLGLAGRLREIDDRYGGAGAWPRDVVVDGRWMHVVDAGAEAMVQQHYGTRAIGGGVGRACVRGRNARVAGHPAAGRTARHRGAGRAGVAGGLGGAARLHPCA